MLLNVLKDLNQSGIIVVVKVWSTRESITRSWLEKGKMNIMIIRCLWMQLNQATDSDP